MPEMSDAFRKCGENEFYSSFSHSEYVLASVSSFCKSQLPDGHISEEEQY